MATSTIVILFLTLATFTHAREIRLADPREDSMGNKLFCGNFFNFPTPATVQPTAPPACMPQAHNMPVAVTTGPCTCGNSPHVTCTVGQICTTTYTGVGTCTTATALPVCITAVSPASTGPCTCANAAGTANIVCITTGMSACVSNFCY